MCYIKDHLKILGLGIMPLYDHVKSEDPAKARMT
jgi:hypothetical protein